MAVTIPRWTASSANSRVVQWLVGRPDASGGSQASAMIWQICSGLNVAGVPERGSSLRRPTITCSRAWSPPSSSAASSASALPRQRSRQQRTASRCIPACRPAAALFFPSAAASTARARRACCCGPLARRVIRSNTRRCQTVTLIACGAGPDIRPLPSPLTPGLYANPPAALSLPIRQPKQDFQDPVLASMLFPLARVSMHHDMLSTYRYHLVIARLSIALEPNSC